MTGKIMLLLSSFKFACGRIEIPLHRFSMWIINVLRLLGFLLGTCPLHPPRLWDDISSLYWAKEHV